MKRLALLTLCLTSTASALLSPTQLAQLVKTPDTFKPTDRYTDGEVNTGFTVSTWVWGKGIVPTMRLQRSPTNRAAWALDLGSATSGYTLARVAPQRKLLAVIDDPVMNVKLSIYQLTGGPLKGTYALDSLYKDGSGGVELQTKAFALAAGQGSELQKNGNTFLLSYPLYGLLYSKARMCNLPEVDCK